MSLLIQVVAGLILLFLGGEALVRGSVSMARRLGVSALVIGLTVTAFGTSAPELVVSVDAVLEGNPDIAVGNVVGSNIANILLVLGVSALIYPLACKPQSVYRGGAALLAATLVFVGMAWFGAFDAREGAGLLLLLVLFVGYSYRTERAGGEADPGAELHIREAEEVADVPGRGWVAVAIVGGGIVALVVGANLLVVGAVGLARAVRVSEAVIGLTLVAVGTSLPELATSVVAAVRRHADVAIGNVIGSNVFNLLGVMGAAALAGEVAVADKIRLFDLWIMLAVTVVLLPVMIRGWRISRGEAGLFLIAYGVYVAVQYYGVPGGGPAAAGLP
jgi:cation:H+ antiporter